MIAFLILQIRLGRITVEEIPEKYRDAVRALLSAED